LLPDLQWIQYQLDRWATVDEVVQHADEVRVSSRTARIHFLACDRTAKCAAVEFVDGTLVVHSGDQMPVRTLTNDTYEASCSFLQRHEGFGGEHAVPASNESLDRFVRASSLAASAQREDRGKPGLVDDAFAILASVSMGQYSVWNLVYEPLKGRIHYRTYDHPGTKRIDLASLELSCAAGARWVDMDEECWGDVRRWLRPYDPEANIRLVRTSFGRSRVRIPLEASSQVGLFPNRFHCTNAGR
jgi:penicillin V acylase-like amidase (Ntn superfamily)